MWQLIFRSVVLTALLAICNGRNPCNKRSFGQSSFVCVCSTKYCDTIDPVQPTPNGTFIAYTSDKHSKRFALETGNISQGIERPKPMCGRSANCSRSSTEITVNRDIKLQEILGFGGAFTDATGINVNKLSPEMQAQLLETYFGHKGIEYNFGRVPIGGTDFSTRAYSYDDTETDDPKLKNFTLKEEDHKYKIPLLKKAKEINPDLRLFGSAWTAPRWLKTNNQFTGGRIKVEYYQTWADYFIKFFEHYEKEGVTFWGVTTGNEPILALMPVAVNSVAWSGVDMRKWVGENLGPTIRNSKYKNLKIMCLDDQRFFLPWYPEQVLSNGTDKYIDGIAVHWYFDRLLPAALLTETHQKFPTKFILNTEACRGERLVETAVLLGDWSRAEDYAHGIIQDINNFVTGWVDWNMALDSTGGPTYINNQVDSPIIVNGKANEFYKQPMYYAFGHFSKFIPRGSHKIAQQLSDKNVEVAAFVRPDDGIVVVLLNILAKEHKVVINDVRRGHIDLNLPPRSITTVLYW